VTYAELDRQANGVARTLLAARGPGAEVIAVLLPNGPLLVAVVLGIWKAGKAVVPLDPVFPPSRIADALALRCAAARDQPRHPRHGRHAAGRVAGAARR
jgi:non-ribosomal peptide synthetase component F